MLFCFLVKMAANSMTVDLIAASLITAYCLLCSCNRLINQEIWFWFCLKDFRCVLEISILQKILKWNYAAYQ